MSVSRFYLCAIPESYWNQELNGVDITRFASDALECERRIGKEVNLENEHARYTLLCQQLEREVVRSGKVQSAKNNQEFQSAVESGHFAAQPMRPGYLALLSRSDEGTSTWRLGRTFFFPKDVADHAREFMRWTNAEGVGETAVVRQRAAFFQMAASLNCGVIEIQSGFHPTRDEDQEVSQQLYAESGDEEDGQHIEIPEFALSGIEIDYFGRKGRKQHYARILRKQIQDALQSGEPVSFGNQAPHDVITEVLHEFVFVPQGETIKPVNLRIMYADGSEAEPFPLTCLPQPTKDSLDSIEPLRVTLMSMRHLEMDPDIDFCWFRNREVSRTRTLSETDQFCFETTRAQFKDSLKMGGLILHLFHTGFEPAIIGFYRGVVHTLLQMKDNDTSKFLSVTPFYFRGPNNPYQTGNPWQ